MSRPYEVNKMIIEKLKQADVEKPVKDFINEILKFEMTIANQPKENVRYTDDYFKIIVRYVPKKGGEEE